MMNRSHLVVRKVVRTQTVSGDATHAFRKGLTTVATFLAAIAWATAKPSPTKHIPLKLRSASTRCPRQNTGYLDSLPLFPSWFPFPNHWWL